MNKEIYKPGTIIYLGPDIYYEAMSDNELDRTKWMTCTVVSDRVRQRDVRFLGDTEWACRDYIIVAGGMELYHVYVNDDVDLRLTPAQRVIDCVPGIRVKLASDAVKWDSRLKDLAGEELVVGSYVYYDEEEKKACVNVAWRCGMAKVTMHVVGPWDCFKRIEDR